MAETARGVLVAEALEDVMKRVDRRDALGEAQVAVLEAAVRLIRADQPEFATLPLERTDLLREALGSVRAAVVATGAAVTWSHQMSRRPA